MGLEWRTYLSDLLSGPFEGRGGNRALCGALGIHPVTLKFWKSGRASPTYDHRQALERVWREKCGNTTGGR